MGAERREKKKQVKKNRRRERKFATRAAVGIILGRGELHGGTRCDEDRKNRGGSSDAAEESEWGYGLGGNVHGTATSCLG